MSEPTLVESILGQTKREVSTIAKTPASWFLRGLLTGILLCAALNAISYFCRSEDFGNLLGNRPEHREAIGFPLQAWESNNTYNGLFADYFALSANVACGLALGTVCGFWLMKNQVRLNAIVAQFEHVITRAPDNFQFSVRGLLLMTSIVAVLTAIGRHLTNSRPEVLGAIFLLGPTALIMIAFLPRRIPWQQRVMILVPTAVLLIAGAIAVGGSLPQRVEFDKILMGIFICWTPQSVLAALLVLFSMLIWHWRKGT